MPNLTFNQFRILDVLVTMKEPLERLIKFKEEDIQFEYSCLFNRRSPSVKAGEMTDLVHGLLKLGMVAIEFLPHPVPSSDFVRPIVCESTAPSVISNLPHYDDAGRRAMLGLTKAGGYAWEQMANPYWDFYFTKVCDRDFEDDPPYVQEFATRALMLNYLTIDCRELHVVRQGSVKVEDLNPWQATYWKQLPSGIRLEYALDFDAITPEGLPVIVDSDIPDSPRRYPLYWYTDPEMNEGQM